AGPGATRGAAQLGGARRRYASAPSRCRSAHHAHVTVTASSANPTVTTAITLGGGAPFASTAYSAASTTTSPHHPHRPMASRALVVRAYSHTPATNRRLSTTTAPATEFHNPRPSFVSSPGASGMSARWVTQSSTQWLTTPKKMAI